MELTRAKWRKSSRSGGAGNNCVEVADNLPGVVGMRDSKDRTGPALLLPHHSWASFITSIKCSSFDR